MGKLEPSILFPNVSKVVQDLIIKGSCPFVRSKSRLLSPILFKLHSLRSLSRGNLSMVKWDYQCWSTSRLAPNISNGLLLCGLGGWFYAIFWNLYDQWGAILVYYSFLWESFNNPFFFLKFFFFQFFPPIFFFPPQLSNVAIISFHSMFVKYATNVPMVPNIK